MIIISLSDIFISAICSPSPYSWLFWPVLFLSMKLGKGGKGGNFSFLCSDRAAHMHMYMINIYVKIGISANCLRIRIPLLETPCLASNEKMRFTEQLVRMRMVS